MRRTERRPRRKAALAFALALLAVAGFARSSDPALEGFGDALARLPADVRTALQTRAAHWAQWSPVQREAFDRRRADWDALSAAQRGEQRERYAAWRHLPTAEQAQVQAAMQRYAALPQDQQQALRAEFDALDRSQRRGWLLGPSLGVDYPSLQPLLAQVPEAEHAPLLQALRALTPRQRGHLAVLVQRTPPQEREALRRELLATPAAGREEWLQSRLER